jgi:ATP synthase protein I
MSEKPGSDEGSFEERLRTAREREGLDTRPPEPSEKIGGFGGSPWGIGLRVGIEMVSALLVGVAIGWGLDRVLGTKPILLAVFVLLGGAAGVLNVWRIYAPRR